MSDKKKKSYVENYIEKLQDLKGEEESETTNLTLRIDTYYDKVLRAVVKELGTKKSPFLKVPLQDLIMKSAQTMGICDDNMRINDEYRVEEK